MLHQIRQTMAIEGERAYAVYDGQTGRIVHLHKIVIFSGAAGCTPQEEEERALTLARRFGHSSQSLRVRAVAPGELEQVMKGAVITD
jgi:hypothetical protein